MTFGDQLTRGDGVIVWLIVVMVMVAYCGLVLVTVSDWMTEWLWLTG